MLKLSSIQLDIFESLIPNREASPKGGRPPVSKRQALAGIFRILDNGAKSKDLPRRYGSKRSVHRWFPRWVEAGVFEQVMRSFGQMVEESGDFRLYECFVDGTFAKAKGRGDGIGCTKAGNGVKIMILVDAKGVPVAVSTGPANPHESGLNQQLFGFMLPSQTPERVIGDSRSAAKTAEAQRRQAKPTPTTATGSMRSWPTKASNSSLPIAPIAALPRTAAPCVDTRGAGRLSALLLGYGTTAAAASAGRSPSWLSNASLISPALSSS